MSGTILVDPPGELKAMPLAGFKVVLRSGDKDMSEATTDDLGRFTFVNPPVGSYRLCWSGPAWTSGCRDQVVELGGRSLYVPPTRVSPHGRFLYGSVVGSESAPLEVRGGGHTVATATVNALGQYLVGGLPDDAVAISVPAGDGTTPVRPGTEGTRMDLVVTAHLAFPLATVVPTQAPPPTGTPTPAATPAHVACTAFNYRFPCPPGHDCTNPKLALYKLRSTEAEAGQYYGAVDLAGKRKTLEDWFSLAGFDSSGRPGPNGTYERAFYANDNDLGFGRDMHFLETTFGTFAYVTNYADGCTLQAPGNAALAHKAPAGQRIATVAMEWSSADYKGPTDPGSSADPATRFVKFFVFAGDGARQSKADLDGLGARFIPGLCINCHGGQEYAGSENVLASFLPFDLDGFKFDGNPDYAAFRRLNAMVKATNPSADIVAMIDGWYPAGGDDVPDRFRPATWTKPPYRQRIYDAVVARSCRTCHTALIQVPTWSDWSDWSNPTNDVGYPIQQGVMPHAVITKMNMYNNAHWPDVEGPRILQCFLDHSNNEDAMRTCIESTPP